MAFNEKEAAMKLLVLMGFEPEIAALINAECDLTVAVFARNGQGTIEKNKQLMAAAAERGLGYRAVSGDGLFVSFPKPKAAAKPLSEIEKLKAERDALQARLAAIEAKATPAQAPVEEEVVQPARTQPSRNNRTRPAPPPIDDEGHFG